ncbi:MAG: D-amino-acid transaminase [Methylocystis sp.]|nr:D-amino-acid transaminase [Methylocystis sp.]
MTDIAYVNGAFTPLAEARVSILDRGFLFADGVYEVAAVIDGKLIDHDAHMARLRRSLGELRLQSPVSMDRIFEIERELVAHNNVSEGVVYLQITRGAGLDRDFPFPKDVTPTFVAFTQKKDILSSAAARYGVKVLSVPDQRWARRDIKSIALLAQVLAKQAAVDVGCQEAWMVDAHGYVTEGSSSTAFIVTKAGEIVTRPNSNAILPGCTRKSVEKLCARERLKLVERAFTIAQAHEAAEAFITGASNLVMPVVEIDGNKIGDGAPGATTRALRALYLDMARATAD